VMINGMKLDGKGMKLSHFVTFLIINQCWTLVLSREPHIVAAQAPPKLCGSLRLRQHWFFLTVFSYENFQRDALYTELSDHRLSNIQTAEFSELSVSEFYFILLFNSEIIQLKKYRVTKAKWWLYNSEILRGRENRTGRCHSHDVAKNGAQLMLLMQSQERGQEAPTKNAGLLLFSTPPCTIP
jgi:hypothetical protein